MTAIVVETEVRPGLQAIILGRLHEVMHELSEKYGMTYNLCVIPSGAIYAAMEKESGIDPANGPGNTRLNTEQLSSPPCPSCGELLISAGSCYVCPCCGWNSGCG